MPSDEWRDRLEERIINLQSVEATQNDRLADHDEELQTIREMLEGHAEDRNDNGMKGEIHDLSVATNMLKALMQPDSLGHGGVIARLRALERNAGFEEKASENRWKFFTAVAVAFLSLAGLAFSNLDKIERFLNRKSTDPVDQLIEKARHPKARRRHIVIRKEPEPSGTDEDVP